MIKQTIEYTDIDNVVRTEDFYFNLTKAEMLELQVSRQGGYADSIKAIMASEDSQLILSTIKEIILAAYGERSAESRHFVKEPHRTQAFSHTEAYSNLFMSLFDDAGKAAAFFNGLLPTDIAPDAAKTGTTPKAPSDRKSKAGKVVEIS